MKACISTLEAGNREGIAARTGEARTIELVKLALLTRLLVTLTSHCVPSNEEHFRSGDYHLAVGISIVKADPALAEAINPRLNAGQLNAAVAAWDALIARPGLNKLVFYRNKNVAHLSEYPPRNEPILQELFYCVGLLSAVADGLVIALGFVTTGLDVQVAPYEKSAELFWAHLSDRWSPARKLRTVLVTLYHSPVHTGRLRWSNTVR